MIASFEYDEVTNNDDEQLFIQHISMTTNSSIFNHIEEVYHNYDILLTKKHYQCVLEDLKLTLLRRKHIKKLYSTILIQLIKDSEQRRRASLWKSLTSFK